MGMMRSLWLGVGLCLTAMLWLRDAGAQTADEFYLGKRELTLITSGATGGGAGIGGACDEERRGIDRFCTARRA